MRPAACYYDIFRDVAQVVDRNGRFTELDYDRLGRQTAERWFVGITLAESRAWQYDKLSRLQVTTAQIQGAAQPGHREEFYYDNLGRITLHAAWDPAAQGATQVLLGYTYDIAPTLTGDADWLATEVTQFVALSPNQRTFVTTRTTDRLGRLMAFEEAGAGGETLKIADFLYDDDGRLTDVGRISLLGATVVDLDTSYAYDGAGRLDLLGHRLNNTPRELARYDYAYDRADRITQLRTLTSWVRPGGDRMHLDRSDAYTYDDAGRLANWQQTTQDAAFYTGHDLNSTTSDAPVLDDGGNRTAGQVSSSGNRLISGGGKEYVYDREGNLLRRWTGNVNNAETRYVWDHRNRLVEVGEYANASAGASSFTQRVVLKYDNNDLLISKSVTVGGATTTERYAYENGQRILQLDAAGQTTHRFHYGPGTDALLADEVFGSTGAVQDLLWTATDHLGTVRDVVSTATGKLVNHLEYDEHGVITRVVNGDKYTIAVNARAIDAAFAGREFVDELGLSYNRARWYDPATERFISEDPAQADPNLYRYAGNNSPNETDPSGRVTQKPTNYLAAIKPALPNFDYNLPRSSGSIVADTFRSTPRVNNSFPTLSVSTADVLAQQFRSGIDFGQKAPRAASRRTELLSSVDRGVDMFRAAPVQTGSYTGDLLLHAGIELGAQVDRTLIGLRTHFRADTQQDRVEQLLRRNNVIHAGQQFHPAYGMAQLYAMGTTDQIAFGSVGYDPIQNRELDGVERISRVAGGGGATILSATPALSAARLVPAGVLNPTIGFRRSVAPNRINTPYGPAIQDSSVAALNARSQIQQGAAVYKGGVLRRSETGASQFFATENPLNPGYAGRYGIPSGNANFDFILKGTVRPGAPVITRPAPGIPPNFGGGIEGVVRPGEFIIDSFHMP